MQDSKRGFYESAVTCFRQAEQPSLQRIAAAHLLKLDAREAALKLRASAGGGGGGNKAERQRRLEVDELFLTAAEAFLAAKLGPEAASCLSLGKDYERAATLYNAEGERTGSREMRLRAARCFYRLKRFDDSIETLWRSGFHSEAIKQVTAERRFVVAARILEGLGEAGAAGVAAGEEVRAMARIGAKDALAAGEKARLLVFLKVLPVPEQVLKSRSTLVFLHPSLSKSTLFLRFRELSTSNS